jgi:hypothetical protein
MNRLEFTKLEVLLSELKQKTKPSFQIDQFCFDKQVAFINDTARFKTAVCSRRSGKTIACAAHLISVAIANAGRVCVYITLSRANAKKIIWGEVLEINRNYQLGGVPNETDLSLKFPNGSVVYFSGASDKSEIDKFRGLAITLCYLDECQSFPGFIENLVEEVITKALFDYSGTLCLIGTPGPIPQGYFYQCATSSEWSHHAWTMFENPHLVLKSGKTPETIVKEEITRKGVGIDDPTIQRECFGRWVVDPTSLVFVYDADINHFDRLPDLVHSWEYIIGVDLGFNDADAVAVIGFNTQTKAAYLVEESIKTHQGITELVEGQLDPLVKQYNPMRIVMDTGGVGLKVAEEIRRRYGMAVQAAEKTRKMEFIEILNDAMRTERFFAKKTTRFAEETKLIEWDWDKSTPDKLKISDRFHSDIADAVLYAFRESLHWMFEPEKPKVKAGTPQWMKEQEQLMEQQLERQLQDQQHQMWGEI